MARMSSPNSPTVVTRLRVFAKTSKGFRTRLHRTFSAAHSYAARMDRPGSSPDGDVDLEIVTVRTNSPRMRRTRRSPAASGLSSGRRGPKVVNFKSPPRAVFKSSAAARQACAPDAGIAPAVRYRRPSPRVAGCRHMHASERQGSGGARGGLECLPEIRADRCGRMRRYAARVRPRPLPCSDPDP